jgi:hypothetical protein
MTRKKDRKRHFSMPYILSLRVTDSRNHIPSQVDNFLKSEIFKRTYRQLGEESQRTGCAPPNENRTAVQLGDGPERQALPAFTKKQKC